LASALASAKSAIGFSKLIPRIKREEEFFSAAFEAVVAAAYIDRGYAVEFIEESSVKTPDLKVTRPDGYTSWVECKCRDEVIERDRINRSLWRDLESALVRSFGPAKTNVVVAVKCLKEPRRDELEPLKDFIFKQVRETPSTNIFREALNAAPVLDPTGHYQVVAQIIAPSDESVEGDLNLRMPDDFQYVSVKAEMKVLEAGRHTFRNPSIYAFTTKEISDGMPTVIRSFKSAVKQLPKDGPGVVWLKVPDGAWGRDFEGFFTRLGSELSRELSGDQNRRVNAVIVHARGFERDGLQENSRVYRGIQFQVEHNNPRGPSPKGSADALA
jgi:hypothetical protein